jgi:hypothetical protein
MKDRLRSAVRQVNRPGWPIAVLAIGGYLLISFVLRTVTTAWDEWLDDEGCAHLNSDDFREVLGESLVVDEASPPLWGGGRVTNHDCWIVRRGDKSAVLRLDFDVYKTLAFAQEDADLASSIAGTERRGGLGDVLLWHPGQLDERSLVVFSGKDRVALSGTRSEATLEQLTELLRRFLEDLDR